MMEEERWIARWEFNKFSMPGNWRIEGVEEGMTGSDLLSTADETGNPKADSPLITIVLGF